MTTFEALTEYYGNYDEDGRLTSRHGKVEFLTTVKYIDKYLKRGDRIIEIGAGTGRYSHFFAQQGYQVDAVELIQHNIDIFKSKTAKYEPITITQGNALDLSNFADETYDITLLLGPMYHLYTAEEQRKALSEAVRVTKKGGIIFAAYCNNDAVIVQFAFQKGNIWTERYQKLIDPMTFKATSDPTELFQLYRKEDIDKLMSDFKTERLHYVGTDMVTNFMRETIDSMTDEQFGTYLNYHFYICERPDMIGVTHHILDIFRKE